MGRGEMPADDAIIDCTSLPSGWLKPGFQVI
jgi:hypothetical protein